MRLFNRSDEKLMRTDHRPWPVPSKHWRARQTWTNLLFAHWPVDAATLEKFLPPQLVLDRFEETAWLGIVPFTTSAFRARFLPPIPFMHRFDEINVRTYVTFNGTPGVYFFSLNVANLPASLLSKQLSHGCYIFADVKLNKELEQYQICYHGRGDQSNLHFSGHYSPVSKPFEASRGTLAHWLTERYCFYSISNNHIYQTEILHNPWQLQEATLEIADNSIADFIGNDYKNEKPILHFAKRNDVVVWGTEQVQF